MFLKMNIDLNIVVVTQMIFAVLNLEDRVDGIHLINGTRANYPKSSLKGERTFHQQSQDILPTSVETQPYTTQNSISIHLNASESFENLQENIISDIHNKRKRRSESICPQDLIYGSCPNIIDYPNCKMYHIISVCPWKIENSVVMCLTKTPCYGIHKLFQNLECKPIDGGCNKTDVPAACIAVKPTTKQAKTDSMAETLG